MTFQQFYEFVTKLFMSAGIFLLINGLVWGILK